MRVARTTPHHFGFASRYAVGMSTQTYSDPRISDYLNELSKQRESMQLAELRAKTLPMEWGMMQISVEQGRLMALLIMISGAKRALEIGTFTGYSSLCVAEHLPKDGLLVACDTSPEWTDIAVEEWRKAGLASRVELHLGPAAETLGKLLDEGQAGSFDFAFIDADKVGYPGYFEQCLELLRPGGLIAFDNMFQSGRVLDPGTDSPEAITIRALNEAIFKDERVDPAMVPIGDGLLLVRKR
jgi:predicted O-methyltransferase YrrM